MTCIWVCHSMFKVQAKHHISWRSGAFQRPACRVSKLYFDGKCLGSVKVHPLPNLHLSPICRTEIIQLSNFNTKETSDLDLNFQMVERSKSGADEHGRGWKSLSHGLCSTLSSARVCCITNLCDASCYCTRHLSFVSERVTPPNHGRALQSSADLRLPVDGNLDDAGGGSGGLLRPIPPTAS